MSPITEEIQEEIPKDGNASARRLEISGDWLQPFTHAEDEGSPVVVQEVAAMPASELQCLIL